MEDYRENTYGENIAAVYDDWYPDCDDAALATLRDLAQGGQVLELGIGTGRIALPLSRSGVDVHGIEASEAMLRKLRGKPGGENLKVILGNFADVSVSESYSLIYVLFNTFYSLLTQDEQIHCFQKVAQRTTSAGNFVIEALVPKLSYSDREPLRTIRVGTNEVHIDASSIDPSSQVITSQRIVLCKQGIQFYPTKIRYAWPSELDIMAKLAGMRLRHRWSNWAKAPFEKNSTRHISIYEKVS